MRSGFELLVMAMVLLVAVGGWSQSQSPDNTGSATDTQVQQGPKPAFTYPDTTPSLDFLSQAAENSSLTLGLLAGVGYYDENSETNNLSRVLFRVRPSVEIQQFRPKLTWSLRYSGGLQSYVQNKNVYGNNNLFSQDGNADILWQVSQHWQMHATDNFVYSADPFDSYQISTSTPTLNNPSPSYYYSLSRYTLNQALLELTGKLTTHDTLDFSGTSFLRRTTSSDLVTVPFYNLISYSGRASYNHQISPRLTLGGGYNYTSLDFGHGIQRTGAQTIMLSGQYLIRPNLAVSAWAGPEYSETKTITQIPILGLVFFQTQHSTLWSPAFGGNIGWRSVRNSFRADFSRQISDGGGILATTRTYRGSATYRRELRPRWDGELGATYWNNESITISNRKFWYAILNATVSHEITRSLDAMLQYSYSKQSQTNIVATGNPHSSYNRIEFDIQYHWNHPLGR